MARSSFGGTTRLAAAFLALGALRATAYAQDDTHMEGYRGKWPFHLAVGGGLSLPTGDMGNIFDAGFNGQGSIIIKAKSWPVAFRADGLYSRFNMKTTGVLTPGGHPGVVADKGVGHVGAFTGNLVIPFGSGGISPYILGGGGIYTTRFHTNVLPAAEHQVKGGFDVGGGFNFHLSPIVDGFIEARFHSFDPNSKLFGKTQFAFVPITVGLVW